MTGPDEIAAAYDVIASRYEFWSRERIADIGFYVAEAERSRGPVIELGVGTGRVAVALAQRGIDVIGIDTSAKMLAVCRRRARAAGVSDRLDLRLGDMRRLMLAGRLTDLVIAPFRVFNHLLEEGERLMALDAAHGLLEPEADSRLIFDVFVGSNDRTSSREWLELAPGISERANWDTVRRRLRLHVRVDGRTATLESSWASAAEWSELLVRAGFGLDGCFGSFARDHYVSGPEAIFVGRRLVKWAR